MTSAFICYSRINKDVAHYLAAQLRALGVDAFVDYQSLRAGGFMKQLGREIETRDYFLPIISPDSVISDWVQAEVTWAFTNRKSIIPIRFKPANLANVFVLESMESVDFARWDIDRAMGEAISRLAKLMGITVEADSIVPVSEPMLEKRASHDRTQEAHSVSEARAIDPPSFALGEVQRMFETAASVQDSDPEQALFLYQQVQEFEPDFMAGQITTFVDRQRERVKPTRLNILRRRIEDAKKVGKWAQVKALARAMQELDPDNGYASAQISIADSNVKCEPVYAQARLASENCNTAALKVLLIDILHACPEYGDPSGLLKNRAISLDFAGYLRCSKVFRNIGGPVNAVAFSSDSAKLATATTDRTVRIWSTSTWELINELPPHSDHVKSVAFSPNDRHFATTTEDGLLHLWNVGDWALIGEEIIGKHGQSQGSVAFLPNGSQLVTSRGRTLLVFDIPALSLVIARKPSEGNITGFDSSTDMSRFIFSTDQFSGIVDKGVTLLRALDGQPENLWGFDLPHTGSAYAVAFSNDGEYLAVAGDGITVVEMPRGYRRLHTSAFEAVTDLAFLPKTCLLTLCQMDGSLVLMDVLSSKAVFSAKAHRRRVNSLAVSPDGRFIATGSDDGNAKIWQL